VLVVWKLDRLSRSLRDVLVIMEQLANAKVGFRSLTEAIDTTTPAGGMMMEMVGSFAEFKRAMLRERTRPGWMQPVKTGALADVAQSLRLSSRPKSETWFPEERRLLPTRRGCSTFTSPPFRARWRAQRAHRQRRPRIRFDRNPGKDLQTR
jgi:hypothetical protein